MKTNTFELKFAANGQPLSIKRAADGAELLETSSPGDGFYLQERGEARIPLENLTFEGGRLIARAANKLPAVTFSVKPGDKYLAFRIERLEAVSQSRDMTLHLDIKGKPDIRAMALDYMTIVENRDDGIQIHWRFLSHRHPSNPLGGFALYTRLSDEDEDDTILRIWTGEQLPHPRIEGEWNLEQAHKWVEGWQTTFNDPSQIFLEGKDLDELRRGAEYAAKAGVRQIFLFTHVWRVDPFWPVYGSHIGVNTKVFPRGEEDLAEFSRFLQSRGLLMTLHYVSGGVGPREKERMGDHIDRRLASWGSGTLAHPIDASATTLDFCPAPGVEMPFSLSQRVFSKFTPYPPMLDFYQGYRYMRIDDEIVHVGDFENTDQAVWQLTNCRRGFFNSKAVSHGTDADVAGLIDSYDQNFMPANDSTLLPEMAEEYAGLLNRCKAYNIMFDGAEIHCFEGSWGYWKYATEVYKRLDHPVLGMSSGGIPAPCQLEYRLNSTKKMLGELYGATASIGLEHPSRAATTLLDAHYGLSLSVARGTRSYTVVKPEPMFALSASDMDTFGLSDEVLGATRAWKNIDRIISDEQRAMLLSTFRYEENPLGQAGNWPVTDAVHVLREKAEAYEFVPTAIMNRPGLDIRWQFGQEFGTIQPKQTLHTGDSVALNNPFAAQPPQVIIRNLYAFRSPSAPSTASQAGGAAGEAPQARKADWAFDYEAEMAANKGGGDPSLANILLQPKALELTKLGDTRAEQEGDALVLSIENPLDKTIYNEDELPVWSRQVNMLNHRGIGLWVSGDNSGVILIFQIPGGDYVVPIDFEGRRYIEIPSAQTAWSDARWGWRMGSKRANYEQVEWPRIGFGKIPAGIKSCIKIEGLTALREFPVPIVNPVIRVGNASVRISGNIESGEYLTYDGGITATVYNCNWRVLREVPASADNWIAPAGESKVIVESANPTPPIWIELQALVEGPPLAIGK